MERVRIEELRGLQRNPVEGAKTGPSSLVNFSFEKAGGYLPFARVPSSEVFTLPEALTSYDAHGNLLVAWIDTLTGRFTLRRGDAHATAFTEFDWRAAEAVAQIPRFGAYLDRLTYLGHGLPDGTLFIEPLPSKPTISQDSLEVDGVGLEEAQPVAITHMPAGGALLGVVYAVEDDGNLFKIDLDDDEEFGLEAVTNVTVSGTVVDMQAGNGWLVILTDDGSWYASNDEFSTSDSGQVAGSAARLTWDAVGSRFYIGGDRLFRSQIVTAGAATWSFAEVANNFGLFTAEYGAGVANHDGQNLVAPTSNSRRAVYSLDGGASWEAVWLSGGGFSGITTRRELIYALGTGIGDGGEATGVAVNDSQDVLAVTSTGFVFRRQNPYLGLPIVPVPELTWVKMAENVDGEGVALTDIRWNAARRSWFVTSENGGVFESSDGIAWSLAGRSSGELRRITFDGDGNWYAAGDGASTTDLLTGTSAAGLPEGRYVVAVLATIPTPAGELVTSAYSLEAEVTEATPSTFTVSVPGSLDASGWLGELASSERADYRANVKFYVYVGHDPDFITRNPKLFLARAMRVGDNPLVIRRRTLQGVSADGFQSLNVVSMPRAVAELHLGRVYFTVPVRTVPPPSAVPTVGLPPLYSLAGNPNVYDYALSRTVINTSQRVFLNVGGGVAIPNPLDVGDEMVLRVFAEGIGEFGPRQSLTITYRQATVTVSPDNPVVVTLEPVEAGSAPPVELTFDVVASGSMLELTSASVTTPVTAFGEEVDVAYVITIDEDPDSLVREALRRQQFAGETTIINTELELSEEGGPFTLAWTKRDYVNVADPLSYLRISSANSDSITALMSGPQQRLYVFLENEIFVVYGDPDLDAGTRIENFGVERMHDIVGHDVSDPPARVGGQLYCIHRGRVYAVTAEGVSDQPISAPIDLRSDPIVQVVGDLVHHHVVARTDSGRIYRFDVERREWFEDPFSSDPQGEEGITVTRLVPAPTADPEAGVYYVAGLDVWPIRRPTEVDAVVVFEDVDLDEKAFMKLWRRVRVHTNDDFGGSIELAYRVRDEWRDAPAVEGEDGVWLFTLARGVVGPKIDLRFTFTDLGPSDTMEAPIEIEFAPRYTRR